MKRVPRLQELLADGFKPGIHEQRAAEALALIDPASETAFDQERVLWNDRFLVISDSHDFFATEEVKEEFEKVKKELRRRHVLKYDSDHFGGVATWMYDAAHRMQWRRQLAPLLQDIREYLEKNVSSLPDIAGRTAWLNRAIEINEKSIDKLFLDRESAHKYARMQNIPALSVEDFHVGVISYGYERYKKLLRAFKKMDVPQIDLFETLPLQVQELFFSFREEHFVQYAHPYYDVFGTSVLEDILRRLPLMATSHQLGMVNERDTTDLYETPEDVREITRVGLPVTDTIIVLKYMRHGSKYPEYFSQVRDFYRAQIASGTTELKWIGVEGLVLAAIPIEDESFGDRKDYTKENASRMKKFMEKDLPYIEKTLRLSEKYPLLCENPATLAQRLLFYDYRRLSGHGDTSHHFRKHATPPNDADPYDLADAELLLTVLHKYAEVFTRFGIKYDVEKLLHSEVDGHDIEIMRWLGDRLHMPALQALADDPQFREGISRINFGGGMSNGFDRLSLEHQKRFVQRLHLFTRDSLKVKDRKCIEHIDDKDLAAFMTYLKQGRSYEDFMEDIGHLQHKIQELPDIALQLRRRLGDDRAKPVLNYIIKKRSRDIIDFISHAEDSDWYMLAETLSQTASKRDVVDAIIAISKTSSFMRSIGCEELYRTAMENLECVPLEKILGTLAEVRRSVRTSIFGREVTFPVHIDPMIDNLVCVVHKGSHEGLQREYREDIRSILKAYGEGGATSANQFLANLPGNVSARSALISLGFDVDAFKSFPARHFEVRAQDMTQVYKSRIAEQYEIIKDRLRPMFPEEVLQAQFAENVESVRALLQRVDDPKIIAEIHDHLNIINSLWVNTTKKKTTTADFYVSTDPIEALHMGKLVGSCLRLDHKDPGVNAWAAVVQTVDVNKNVLYAKSIEGAYIGRVRTALTDKGILCTRFYSPHGFDLGEQWVQYLDDLGTAVHADVIIPDFFARNLSSDLYETLKAKYGKRAVKTRVKATLMPAQYDKFYGDGLSFTSGDKNLVANAYVLRKT